ncbi:MAG: hypothetical protein NWE93_12465 [Candidatus Bathyarchaeota archaeon]|nr:hypothetical protein [Candidatus Bathyarchaeota archaeon]
MTQNNNQYLKCPHCNCIFFSQADLERHMAAFSQAKGEHQFRYTKTHGRLEHGYGGDQ